jgi:hypothetical protein
MRIKIEDFIIKTNGNKNSKPLAEIFNNKDVYKVMIIGEEKDKTKP